MILKGVNLGGWLLLEKWITPSLFAGLEAEDEYSFCLETVGTDRLQKHRDTYITKADFVWLADHGINAVRLPIGYWALHDDLPFVNCKKWLDLAFQWASETGMQIMLDLHGAPGSQNGLDHSGRMGKVEWTKPENTKYTLAVLGELTQRYGNHETLAGISLLNEPGWDVPLDTLRQFYKDGYNAVRRYSDEKIAVIISDTFRPFEWNGFMSGAEYKNVMLDVHLYQCFSAEDKALDLAGHIDKTQNEWANIFEQSDKPVMVGEWSLGLDPQTFVGMDANQEKEASKTYAKVQQLVFDQSAGWFFWTYKTEDMPGWSYRHCVNQDLGV